MALPKQLTDYVNQYVPKAGAKEVRKALIEAGWEDAMVDEALLIFSSEELLAVEKPTNKKPAKHNWNWLKMLSLIGVLIVGIGTVGGLGYTYFFILSPTFVDAPEVDVPQVAVDPFDLTQPVEQVDITADQMEYLAVAVDAYKLHPHPTTGELPVMEYIVTDTGEVFSIVIVENKAEVQEQLATDPDIRILGSKRIFLQLIVEPDPADALERYAQEQQLGVEILADEQTLLLKGYKAIYDSMRSD